MLGMFFFRHTVHWQKFRFFGLHFYRRKYGLSSTSAKNVGDVFLRHSVVFMMMFSQITEKDCVKESYRPLEKNRPVLCNTARPSQQQLSSYRAAWNASAD